MKYDQIRELIRRFLRAYSLDGKRSKEPFIQISEEEILSDLLSEPLFKTESKEIY